MSASVRTTSTFMKLHYSCQLAGCFVNEPRPLGNASWPLGLGRASLAWKLKHVPQIPVFLLVGDALACFSLPRRATARPLPADRAVPLSTPSPACRRRRTAYWQ